MTVRAEAPDPPDLFMWTDASGTTNVTPLSAVPSRYRNSARRLNGEISVVSAAPPGPARIPPLPLAASTPAKDQAGQEALWRGRFAKARSRIVEVERQIAAAQEKLTTLRRGVRGMVIPLTAADSERARIVIDGAEAERKKAQDELHDLELQAANAAVPLEWRR